MIFGLSKIQAAVGAATTIALIGVSLWGWRVDTLRAGHLETLNEVVAIIENVTDHEDLSRDQIPQAVRQIADERDLNRANYNRTRRVLTTQSDTIREYEDERARLIAVSEQNRILAAQVTEERDAWIRRAQEASTRLERLTAEEELQRCEGVLDALYEAGF